MMNQEVPGLRVTPTFERVNDTLGNPNLELFSLPMAGAVFQGTLFVLNVISQGT